MPARPLQRGGTLAADCVQSLVDLEIDPGDEERGHRVNRAQVAAGGEGQLQPGEVRIDHLAEALETEDQCDVDADSLGNAFGDRAEAWLGGGDLDERVRTVDRSGQCQRLVDRPGRVVGDAGAYLDGYAAIHVIRCVIHRLEERCARITHVGGGQLEGHVGRGGVRPRQSLELVVIRISVAQSGGEDGRVRRDPDHVAIRDEALECTGPDPISRQIVEPNADTGIRQGLRQRSDLIQICSPPTLRAGVEA